MKKLIYSLVLMFLTASAAAQVTTSSMSGKVTDQNGQPLIGAAVIAVHTPSGTQYGTVAETNGNFRLLNLRPGGPYTVTFQMIGYSANEITGIELALGDNFVLDSNLEESALGMETVYVMAIGSSNMNTDRAGAITSINARGIEATPTISRSINDIARYSPQSASTSNGLAIGGGNYRQSYVTVDGAAFNNAFGIGENLPSGGNPISLDALDQITVSITPYDVRQSGFTGGAINAVTRSGDNEFRASVYTYLNNENFKGYKIRNDQKFEKDEQKDNIFGLRFGGPIIKNKLFFFVNAEMEREISPGPTSRARPTSDTDWGSGTSYNRPTVDMMDQISQYLRDEYGYDPGAYQGYSNKAPSWKLLARLDWNINENHKLNLRYSTTHSKYSASPSSSTSPFSTTAYPNGGSRGNNTALNFKNSRYWQEQNFSSFAGELNSVFGRVTNTFRATFSHQDEPRSWDGGVFPTVDILSDEDSANGPVPYTTFGLDPFSYGNLRDVKTFIVTDDVNWTWGINNMTAGVQYEFDRTKNGYMRYGAGWYVYESWDDFVNDKAPYSFAMTHSNREDLAQVYPSFDYHQFSIYLQDKIDVTDNFKLTAGLRIEVPFFPSLEDNFNPGFADLDFAGKKYSTDQMPKARVQLSPRVGFNWDVRGDRVHVIRGGVGIFTGRLPFVWIVSAVGDSGVKQVTKQFTGSDVPSFHTNIQDILTDLYGGNYTPGDVALPSNPTIMDKDLKMPSTLKVSLAYDVRLPGGILGTLEGIYNRNINQVVVTNIGLQESSEDIKLSENDVRKRFATTVYNEETKKYSTSTNYYHRGVVPYLIENGGKAGWYYSLTAKLEKNLRWLNAMVAYTYSDSRTLGDGIGDQVSSAWSTNNYHVESVNDHKLSYGSYVSPHRLIASLNFRIQKNTTLGIFYEGSNLGYYGSTSYTYTRYSYTYTSNVVGDGGAYNLIYVPNSPDELTFVDYADGSYSAADQAADFWAFVNQDKYLKTRKGKYAERNGAVMPWRSRFDIKYLRDFSFNVGGKVNTLQIGIDIINVMNLLNKNWGNIKTVNNATPLAVVTNDDGTVAGFRFQRNGSETLNKTFNPVARYASTYSFQLSFRYIFN